MNFEPVVPRAGYLALRPPLLLALFLSTLFFGLLSRQRLEAPSRVLPPSAGETPLSTVISAPSPAAPTAVSPITVLMYHRIVRSSEATQFEMPLSRFEAQMDWLVEHGFQTVASSVVVAHLKDGASLPPKSILLTFDDWSPDHFDLVRPALNRRGLKGIFFVITEKASSASEKEKLRTLYAEGHEIASHTIHHYYLTQSPCDKDWKCCQERKPCTESQIETELAGSKSMLEATIEAPVTSFAWPGNFHTEDAVKMALAAGYQATFAVEDQQLEAGHLVNRVGITRSASLIYRTEIGGPCDMSLFPEAVSSQRCCALSSRPFHQYCLKSAGGR